MNGDSYQMKNFHLIREEEEKCVSIDDVQCSSKNSLQMRCVLMMM